MTTGAQGSATLTFAAGAQAAQYQSRTVVTDTAPNPAYPAQSAQQVIAIPTVATDPNYVWGIGSAGEIVAIPFWYTGSYYSTDDGATWTYTTGTISGPTLVKKIGSTWIALKGDGSAWSSADGQNWTSRTMASAGKNWYLLATSGSLAIAIASDNTVNYSTDGVNWSAGTSVPAAMGCLAYANGVFLACTSSTTAYTTTNGTGWTTVTLPFSASTLPGPTTDGTEFIFTDISSVNIAKSTDGASWVSSTVDASTTADSIHKSGSTYYYIDSGTGAVWTSTNFSTWTNTGYKSIKSPTYFVGRVGSAIYGINNSPSKDLVRFNIPFNSFAYVCLTGVSVQLGYQSVSGAGFICFKAEYTNDVYFSTDALAWSMLRLPANGFWSNVVYNGTYFLCIDSVNGKVARTTNFSSWSIVTMTGFVPNPYSWLRGNYSSGAAGIPSKVIFAAQFLGLPWISSDSGATWATIGTFPTSGFVYQICTSGSEVIVSDTGSGSQCFRSSDGVTWSGGPATITPNFPITWDGFRYWECGGQYSIDLQTWVYTGLSSTNIHASQNYFCDLGASLRFAPNRKDFYSTSVFGVGGSNLYLGSNFILVFNTLRLDYIYAPTGRTVSVVNELIAPAASSPGSNAASVTVTGQTGLLATDCVDAWIQGDDSTASHNSYEHRLLGQMVKLSVTNVVAGVGFDIVGISELRLDGDFKVRWAWAR